MIDTDVRALQIKRLDEFGLANLHRKERDRGHVLLPMEINRIAGWNLKSFYGVPLAKRGAIGSWAKMVRETVARFVRENRLHPSFEPWDLDHLHEFDDAIWRSDVDFHWRAAPPARVAKDLYQP